MKNLVLIFAATAMTTALAIGCGDDQPKHQFDRTLALADGTPLPPSVMPALDPGILTPRGGTPGDEEEETAQPGEEAQPEPAAENATAAEPATAPPAAKPVQPPPEPARAPKPRRTARRSRGFGGTPLTESMTGLGVQAELSGGNRSARPSRPAPVAAAPPPPKPKSPAPAPAGKAAKAPNTGASKPPPSKDNSPAGQSPGEPKPHAATTQPTTDASGSKKKGGRITGWLRRGVRAVGNVGQLGTNGETASKPAGER